MQRYSKCWESIKGLHRGWYTSANFSSVMNIKIQCVGGSIMILCTVCLVKLEINGTLTPSVDLVCKAIWLLKIVQLT